MVAFLLNIITLLLTIIVNMWEYFYLYDALNNATFVEHWFVRPMQLSRVLPLGCSLFLPVFFVRAVI